jgi:adenosylcobinamide kinase/adenosylcobinamide-phosphate guanylyltransferase
MRYVATAKRDESDAEWTARLEHHRSARPVSWDTTETAHLATADFLALFDAAVKGDVLLVDSLGGWLDARIAANAQRIEREYAAVESLLDTEAQALAASLEASAASVIVVGEEVGWGIVPLAASARLYRDVLGRLHQRLAASAAAAYLVVSGYAIDLRATGERV